MQTKIPTSIDGVQDPVLQDGAGKRTNVRRRASSVNRASLELLDSAVEARRDTEEPAREWELRRPDVQDLFAQRTRQLLRKLEGEIRQMRAELRGRAA